VRSTEIYYQCGERTEAIISVTSHCHYKIKYSSHLACPITRHIPLSRQTTHHLTHHYNQPEEHHSSVIPSCKIATTTHSFSYDIEGNITSGEHVCFFISFSFDKNFSFLPLTPLFSYIYLSPSLTHLSLRFITTVFANHSPSPNVRIRTFANE
jgi:hypothetical protein